MKTYTQEQGLPVVVITLATRADSIQPIIFTSRLGVGSDNYPKWEGRTLPWAVEYCKVTLVRDWSISQAQFRVVAPLTGPNLPPLPDVSSMRGGDYPYVGKEDEIRIYMGYVPSGETPITADLLDDYPFSDPDGNWEADPCKPLCPVFWGFIDTVSFIGSKKGISYTFLCRDRGRIFADTRIVSMSSILGSKRGASNGLRHRLILDVAAAASGRLFSTGDTEGSGAGSSIQEECWKKIEAGNILTLWDSSGDGADVKYTADGGAPGFEDPAAWIRKGVFPLMREDTSPRFHIWAQRPPLVRSNGAQLFNAVNMDPLSILDWLAKTEERVTDFFSSHVNGDFIFGPRVMDTSGFSDPDRLYRTYFFLGAPCGMEAPPYSQRVLSLRALSSSMATYNRFVVTGTDTSSGSQAFVEAIQTVLTTNQKAYWGRSVAPPCRTQIIIDGNLSTYNVDGGSPVGACLLLGLNAAQATGRDANGIEFEVVGDPTLCPGEGVQVYNTGLHDNYVSMFSPSAQKEVTDSEKSKHALSRDKSIKRGKGPVKEDADKDSKFNAILQAGRVDTNKEKGILPVYLVRNVQHIFTATKDKTPFITRIRGAANYG